MERKQCLKCEHDACAFYHDNVNNTVYFVCRACGKIWREISGDVPAEDFLANELDMMTSLPIQAFEALTDASYTVDMQDYVHKCFVCQSLAFEIEMGYYRCSDDTCGFEWEVYQGE